MNPDSALVNERRREEGADDWRIHRHRCYWYFWDESDSRRLGPFLTWDEAKVGMEEYSKLLNRRKPLTGRSIKEKRHMVVVALFVAAIIANLAISMNMEGTNREIADIVLVFLTVSLIAFDLIGNWGQDGYGR